jgi:hypothetical protein
MNRQKYRRKDYKRNNTRPKEKPKQGFIIFCQGEKTEPLYFEGFKKKATCKVNIQEGNKESPSQLVKKAKDQKHPYDARQIWVVFDKDDFQDFDKAIDLAEKEGIKTAYSNEAFEIWFLLHFNYINTSIGRKQYANILTNRLDTKYNKCDPTLFKKLEPHINTAIKYAKKLYDTYSPDTPHSKRNPCTTVYRLVQELLKHIPQKAHV